MGELLNQNAPKYNRLKISEVSNNAITLEPENTLLDVRNTLLRYNISRIVIAKNGKALGIITEKDFPGFCTPNHKKGNSRRSD